MAKDDQKVSVSFAHDSGLLRQGGSQIEELVGRVASIATGMWRYRWASLAVAWAVCIVGWSVIYALPDEYQARTRVYIDAESVIRRVVGDLTIPGDVMNQVNVLARAMLSQPRLEKTARSAGLDVGATTPEEHEQLIAELSKRVTISREGGENVFSISFRDSNRQTAETVVKTLLENFVDDALGERRTDSGAATQFIDQQIGEYERRLNESDKRLADFKREKIGLMPGETGDYYTRLQRGLQSVEKIKADLALATDRRNEYRNQLAGEEPVFGIMAPSIGGDGVPLSSTDAQIAQYESDLNTLLLKYTDKNPDVVGLRAVIERLKAQRDADISRTPNSAAQRAAPAGGRLETNSFYQSMRMGEGEADVEMATLRRKLVTEEASVQELQRLVETIPDVERQLTALNRDYAVTREQYEQLLKRRESLHISGEVEQTGNQLQFRIIEPPRASLAPVGPNRPMLLGATTTAGIGLALALALILQQLNPVFIGRKELREITGLPVLGTVSHVESHRDVAKTRQRLFVFAGAAAALPVALALAVLLQEKAHHAFAGLLSVLAS